MDIQGFRNANEKFILKELAIVAINGTIIGQEIVMS